MSTEAWMAFGGLALIVLTSVAAMAWWARGADAEGVHMRKDFESEKTDTAEQFRRHSNAISELTKQIVEINQENAVRDALEGKAERTIPYKPHHNSGDAS